MPDKSAPPMTSIEESAPREIVAQFLVNGGPGSAAADRAERIAHAVAGRTVVTYRRGTRVADIFSMVRSVRRLKPRVVYSMDLAVAPTIAWLLSGRKPFVVDTGDTPRFFLDLINAPLWARWSASLLERVSYGQAERVIVRGQHHKTQLVEAGYGHVRVIPDGVDLAAIKPIDVGDLRARLNLSDTLTVGVQGNFTWYPDLGGGLGWDLIQAIGRRPELPIHAVLVGDGPGIAELRQLADKLNVADRVHVVGRVPYPELPKYLSLCDVTLLTQTNDPSSWARTTGKLPTYLASGRHVLASRVGTAADLLPERHLIDYVGQWDHSYPDRLADRLADIIADRPAAEQAAIDLRELSEQFDYDLIAAEAAAEVMAIAGAS